MKKQRVLILEDDRTTAKLLGKGLEKLGFATTIAANGAEGLYRFAASKKWSAIILDLLMPEVSGYEFLRMLEVLRRSEATLHIPPIIVCSAVERYAELKEIMENEIVFAVTHKPADVAYLAEIIQIASQPSEDGTRKLRKKEALQLLTN